MGKICPVIWFELEHLMRNKLMWFLTSAYSLSVIIICLIDTLRITYFHAIQSVPVMCLDFILPILLVILQIVTLSPIFAGGINQQSNQIPATCVIGRKRRSIAKLCGGVLFSLGMCLLLIVITWLISWLCGTYDAHFLITNIDGEVLSPVWDTRQHILFSVLCLITGSVILSIILLCLSCFAKTSLNAVSVSSIAVLFEYLFHFFSFSVFLKEYNFWLLFQPYYFFNMVLPFLPHINYFLLSLAFVPLCVVAIIGIIKRGA